MLTDVTFLGTVAGLPDIAAAFCRAVGRPERCVVVDGMAHGGAWERVWPGLLRNMLQYQQVFLTHPL